MFDADYAAQLVCGAGRCRAQQCPGALLPEMPIKKHGAVQAVQGNRIFAAGKAGNNEPV